MNPTLDNRRENLRNLIEEWSGPGPLAKKLGYRNASFLVQMAGPNPSRDVTEKTARAIEDKLDLPRGWMDEDPNGHGTKPSQVDNTMIFAIIRAVGAQALDEGINLAPDKQAELVIMAYEDATTHGSIRQEFIKQLFRLMKV